MTLRLLVEDQPVPFYSAELSYSVEQLAHTFRCDIPPMVITTPLSVAFQLDGTTILTGAIDGTRTSTTSGATSLSIYGRSACANMIDSKITMDAQYDQPLDALLRNIAGDFGLGVECLVDPITLPPVDEFQINAESPIANIAQLIREQGLMLIERNGVLTIERPAQARIDGIGLAVGRNIESLDIQHTFNNQFNHIEVQGAWDESHAIVTNDAISAARKIVLICDQLQNTAACQTRADYEQRLAIAKSLTASASLPGLFQALTGDGLNRIIQVTDNNQRFSEMLVIKALGLSVSESAMNTRIELYRPFKEQSHVGI